MYMEGMQTSWKRGVNGEEFVEALLNEKTKIAATC